MYSKPKKVISKWLESNSKRKMPLGTPSVYPFHIIPFHHNYLKWYICVSVMYGIHYIVLQWNYHTVAGTSAPCHISFYSFLVNLILISAYMTRQMFSYTVSSIVFFCLEETLSHWKNWHLSNRHLTGLGSMCVQMCVYVCLCLYAMFFFSINVFYKTKIFHSNF